MLADVFLRLAFLLPLPAFADFFPFAPLAALDVFPAPEAARFFGARPEEAPFAALRAGALFPAAPAGRFLADDPAGRAADRWIIVKRI